jgi:hypothetical protein
MMTPTKMEVQTANQPRRTAPRCGGCTRKQSALRPVSSRFSAFFQNPDSDPKGFLGFSERRDFSRS